MFKIDELMERYRVRSSETCFALDEIERTLNEKDEEILYLKNANNHNNDISAGKIQHLESEIERLKKENEELRIMDKSYKLNWANDKEIINKKDEKIELLKKENKKLKAALGIALRFYAEVPDDEEDELFIVHCSNLLKISEVENE